MLFILQKCLQNSSWCVWNKQLSFERQPVQAAGAVLKVDACWLLLQDLLPHWPAIFSLFYYKFILVTVLSPCFPIFFLSLDSCKWQKVILAHCWLKSSQSIETVQQLNLSMTRCGFLRMHFDILHCESVYEQQSLFMYSTLSLLSSLPPPPQINIRIMCLAQASCARAVWSYFGLPVTL